MFLKTLEKLMKERGLNKHTFSLQSGIPYKTIDNFWKKGYNNVKLGTLRKIAAFFGVSLDFLIFGEEREITLEQKLTIAFSKLNDTGKAKAIEYIDDLAENKKYISDQHAISNDITKKLNQEIRTYIK